MEWVATQFDPETDPSRPKVGDVIDGGTIMKVGWALQSAIVKELMSGVPTEIMNPQGYDECLSKEHPTRPFVVWLVWVNK